VRPSRAVHRKRTSSESGVCDLWTRTDEQTTIVVTTCACYGHAGMGIGRPACKHGVSEPDIWHAMRTATRRIDVEDNLIMLIGPARDGTPLEIGVLDRTARIRLSFTPCACDPSSTGSLGKDDRMKHTEAEIEDAARRFERLADNIDPANVMAEDLTDLRAIAEAADQVRRDEALVTERVAAARARGRSWNRIAVALGVSRQAARHRFADKLG